MEVHEKGKNISIYPGGKMPLARLIMSVTGVLALIWGIFVILLLYFARSGHDMLPYFVAISLLLVVPFAVGILIRQSRYHRAIFFDGDNGILLFKGIWRSWQVPFEQITAFHVREYHLTRDVPLCRFEVALSSGKTVPLIMDVPKREELRALGERVSGLVKRPLKVTP
jgi:hypothetical protein